MISFRCPPALLLLSSVALIAGCSIEHHRWQTVVNEDGSVVRAISQPMSGIPDAAQASEQWETKRFHKDIDRNIWPERITEERIESAFPEQQKESNCIIARGSFETLEQVPQHYRFELDGTDLVSELKHNLTINDYGLVKEYLWLEEITDIVKFEEIPEARRAMMKLLATVVQEGLENGLGDDYDVSGLIRWIETEGDQLVEECTLLVLSKEFRSLDEEERKKRFEAIAARFGIVEVSDEGLQLFVRKRLREGVKHQGGEPLSPEIIDALVDDPNNNDDGDQQPNPYQQAIQAAWKKYVGDEQVRPNRLQILLAKQVGVYGVPFFGIPREFDVWLKLPGTVVETNGIVDEEGFLKWSFDKEDIGPTGYQMTARSILPVRMRDSKVLRKEKLGLRDEMLAFLKLVKKDDELREVVRKCLEQDSIDPLKDLEKLRHAAAGRPRVGIQIRTEEQANWWRVRQMLDLLNQDPPAAAN